MMVTVTLQMPIQCPAAAAIGPATGSQAPASVRLLPCRPNPFRGAGGATMVFRLAAAGRASLGIYDVSGRRVRLLVDGVLTAGRHAATWDGRDDRGRGAPSGVYFYRLVAGGRAETRRLVRIE